LEKALELQPDDLPACYTAVVAQFSAPGKAPDVGFLAWYNKIDNEADPGEPVDVCDARCGIKPPSVCSLPK